MTELERSLRNLPIDWPATPDVAARLEVGRRSHRVLIATVAVAVGLGAAFAVPDSRGAILRFLHLGGVTVEHVDTLPLAQERPLAAGLGTPVSEAVAREALGTAFLPIRHGPLYEQGGFVSTLLSLPEPALLTEFGSPDLIKKLASGAAAYVAVAPGVPGIWIAGKHVVLFPNGSRRLAGNVLVWVHGGVTFRLEAPGLTKARAFEAAREILGTG